MDFEQGLAEVEEAAKKAQLDSSLPSTEDYDTSGHETKQRSLLERVRDLAYEYPDAAIAIAWSEVEAELRSTVERLSKTPGRSSFSSTGRMIGYINSTGMVDEETFNLLHKLRTLRNMVAHDRYRYDQISQEEVIEYASIAQAVIDRLRNIN